MPAQAGNTILLQYGAQGHQQPGSSVLLSYNALAASGSRRIGLAARAPWRSSSSRMHGLDACHISNRRLDHDRKGAWAAALPREIASGMPWVATTRTDGGRAAPWSPFGVTLGRSRVATWPGALRADDRRYSPWGRYGDMLNAARGARWRKSLPADAFKRCVMGSFIVPVWLDRPYIRPNGQAANFRVYDIASVVRSPNAVNFLVDIEAYRNPVLDVHGVQVTAPSNRDASRLNPWGLGRTVDDTTIIPWVRFSRPLNPGWGVIVPGGPQTPGNNASIIIPVRRVYLVVNDFLFTRADDNTPLPASALSIQFDCDSWLPSFSATLPEASRSAVMPDPSPVEVYALVNGSEFKFFVEKITRNRQFGSSTVTISGRGIACELGSPYAVASQHINASSMTAQQLVDASLQYTGYTQTWNISDWLIPAGVFSHFGTPAEVAGQVAEASGSVLSADWLIRDLRMLPRYPVKPWDWGSATPDYVIPAAVTRTESLEWIEKPAYNLVYISGVQAGVLGQVKITGTAGDIPAPMVTHPLITHVDAARQRGISVLSDTGRKAMMQISLPVLDSTGVIDLCRLVEFSDGANTRRGIVRGNQISVQWPIVRQTLTIEANA